jgi:hypothetical protein
MFAALPSGEVSRDGLTKQSPSNDQKPNISCEHSEPQPQRPRGMPYRSVTNDPRDNKFNEQTPNKRDGHNDEEEEAPPLEVGGLEWVEPIKEESDGEEGQRDDRETRCEPLSWTEGCRAILWFGRPRSHQRPRCLPATFSEGRLTLIRLPKRKRETLRNERGLSPGVICRSSRQPPLHPSVRRFGRDCRLQAMLRGKRHKLAFETLLALPCGRPTGALSCNIRTAFLAIVLALSIDRLSGRVGGLAGRNRSRSRSLAARGGRASGPGR